MPPALASVKAACVIGWPVAHSRSPIIHNYWIKELGLVADYRREAVEPSRFSEFVAQLHRQGYVGANVTVPHKEAALVAADPDDRARAVGAANTLWYEAGRLRPTNTDVEGFLANLDASAPGWDADLDSAVVLGAGGAARAVVFALAERDIATLYVANRNFERAVTMRADFGERVRPLHWREVASVLPGSRLLVNATSLGMSGQPPLELAIDGLPDEAVVNDLVYAPLETDLLLTARARRLRTVDGLGMLLHQAVGGFSRWFGVRPQVTHNLRTLVEADLMVK